MVLLGKGWCGSADEVGLKSEMWGLSLKGMGGKGGSKSKKNTATTLHFHEVLLRKGWCGFLDEVGSKSKT